MMADTTEPALRPEQSTCRPSREHVSLDVPALHVAGLFSPISDHVFDRIGAQQCHVERRGKFQAVHREGFFQAITQGEGGGGVSFGEELAKVFEGFRSCFVSFGLAQATEVPLTFGLIPTPQTIRDVALEMNEAGLLHGFRPDFSHCAFDCFGAVTYDKEPPILLAAHSPLLEASEKSGHGFGALGGSRLEVEDLLSSCTVDPEGNDDAVLTSNEHSVDHDREPVALVEGALTQELELLTALFLPHSRNTALADAAFG